MQVELTDIGKNYQDHAVFKKISYVFPQGYRGVVLGGNGSGKSTLLKIISTALAPSTGSLVYTENNRIIAAEKRHLFVAFCAPYIDLIEDFTLQELIAFQASFKPFVKGISAADIVQRLYLSRFKDRQIKTYSSGMKQRVRLALTVLADTPLLLLDEPTSNLDPEGRGWYRALIEEFAGNRSIIAGSNHLEEEYFFANDVIDISGYKPAEKRLV